MLDKKHLITLKTIKNTDSIAEAAKIVNLTLSALSHQIKQIESFYDCQLFIRKSKPLQFTPQGQLLLDLAEKVLPLFHQAEQTLKQDTHSQPSHFNMALECHSCYRWLMPTINDLRKRWPDVETDLSAEFNFHPLPKLMSKELDVVISSDPVDNLALHFIPLFNFEMAMGVSVKSILAKKKSGSTKRSRKRNPDYLSSRS